MKKIQFLTCILLLAFAFFLPTRVATAQFKATLEGYTDLEERITVGLRIRNDRVAKIRKCKLRASPPKDREKRLLPRFIAIFILTQQRGKNKEKMS